ncbi:MAG: hypothetical protein BECKG1743D_GA0114223_105663 [Candidatus Kentron sp. G]|nr:MAG: hypothetical protein BECKG1743F_GA0114225_105832 [Candidatus Kentron sp. G]VFN02700.1 MAG: hypothetical protein BECKG1743E_GA0114224_105333 [Candidatus Kentron sp. G]VFN04266.1 MAG: hypothetical protein BECKG1743D_GA0114223_105663 [Candidatus Kentron sp. G]
MREYPKSIRKELRRLTGLAHEREMALALGRLEQEFGSWRKGEISPHELNDRIHKHHNGTARNLWSIYTGNDNLAVVRAVCLGVIERSEIAKETLATISDQIDGMKGTWDEE